MGETFGCTGAKPSPTVALKPVPTTLGSGVGWFVFEAPWGGFGFVSQMLPSSPGDRR